MAIRLVQALENFCLPLAVLVVLVIGFVVNQSGETLHQAQISQNQVEAVIQDVNSLLGTLSNTLKRGFLPSAPKCVQGETPYLLEALWTATGRTERHSLVTVILDLKCDGTVTHIEVLALIPDNMERALVAAHDAKPDGE